MNSTAIFRNCWASYSGDSRYALAVSGSNMVMRDCHVYDAEEREALEMTSEEVLALPSEPADVARTYEEFLAHRDDPPEDPED